MKKELEAMLNVENYKYQSDFARKYYFQGKAEGMAEMLLEILKFRGLKPTEAERQTILTCRDLQQVERWSQRVFQAESFQELLAD